MHVIKYHGESAKIVMLLALAFMLFGVLWMVFLMTLALGLEAEPREHEPDLIKQ